MSTTITTDFAGQINVFPRVIRIDTDQSYATITAAGFLNQFIPEGFAFYDTDMVAVAYADNYNADTTSLAWFSITFSAAVATLVPLTNTITFPVINTVTETSATPGTVRTYTGKMVETATTMTSGNIVGVRGEVDYVGASGGFIYGVQGKVFSTGTSSGSVWVAGVFGQFDLSAATPGAAQFATIWGDYGTTATAGTYTGARGIAMTNTTAAILNSQLYLYGAATNLLELDDNHGLSGATYFVAAGTGSGSWGHATVPPATFVLKITVNGTNYWLPLASSNS
jgi:hypothetical protein